MSKVHCQKMECLHDEHRWHPRISQMLGSTHDDSIHVEYQQKSPDNPANFINFLILMYEFIK